MPFSKWHHTSAQWVGFPQLPLFVIAGQRTSQKLSQVIHPVHLDGSECWPTLNDKERCLAAMKPMMLRWTNFVTFHDHIRNKVIHERYEVASFVKKLWERLLRWYGQKICANKNSLAKVWTSRLDTLDNDLGTLLIKLDQAFDEEKWQIHQDRPNPAEGAKV